MDLNSPAEAEIYSVAERVTRMGGGRSDGANPGPLPCLALDQGAGLGLSKFVALRIETHFILIFPLNPAACGGCATARMN